MELEEYYGNIYPDIKPGWIYDQIEMEIKHSDAAPCLTTAVKIEDIFFEHDSLVDLMSNYKNEIDWVWQNEFENSKENHCFLLKYTGSYSSIINDPECVTMGTVAEVIYQKSIGVLVCSSKKESLETCSDFVKKIIDGLDSVLDEVTISSCKKCFIYDGHVIQSCNKRSYDSVTLCLKEVARLVREMKSRTNLNVKLFKFSTKNMIDAKNRKHEEPQFFKSKVFQSSDDKLLDNGSLTRYSFGDSFSDVKFTGESSTCDFGVRKNINKVTTDIEPISIVATLKEANVNSTVNKEFSTYNAGSPISKKINTGTTDAEQSSIVATLEETNVGITFNNALSTYKTFISRNVDKVTTDIEQRPIIETNVCSTVNKDLCNSEYVTKGIVPDLHTNLNKNIPLTLDAKKYVNYTDKVRNLDSNKHISTEASSKPYFSAATATKESIMNCSSSEKGSLAGTSVAIIKETKPSSKEINEPCKSVSINNTNVNEKLLHQQTTDDQNCMNKACENEDDWKYNSPIVSKPNSALINLVTQPSPIPTKRTTVPSYKSNCSTVTKVNNELINNVNKNGSNGPTVGRPTLNQSATNKIVKEKHVNYRGLIISLTVSELNGFKTVEVGSKKETNEKAKAILLLGATGSGKTALLNMIANFYFGAQSAEEEKLFIDEAKAKTDRVTVYTFYPERENQLPITVIDTPGLNDSTGAEIHDHVDALKSFLAVACSHGLEIHAIGFVAQAHLVRLTSSEKLVMDYVTSIFGADVKEHIMALVTFSDNQPTPPVVEAMKRFGLESPFFVKFNNTLLISRSGVVDELDKIYWRTGLRSWKKCLKFLKELSPLSTAAISSVQSEVFNKSVLSKCSEVLRSEISTLIMLSSGKNKLQELYSEDLRKQRSKVWLASNVAFNLEEVSQEESKETYLLNVCLDLFQRIPNNLSSDLLLFILLDEESVMRDVVLTSIKSLANFNESFVSVQLFDNRQKYLIAQCLNCQKDCFFKKTSSYTSTRLKCGCFCDGGMHGPPLSERHSLPNLPILRQRFISSTRQSLIDTISQYTPSNVERPVLLVFNHLLCNELRDSKRLIRNIWPLFGGR